MPKSDPKFVVRPATKDNANLSNQVTARNMNVDLESVATAPYVALSFFNDKVLSKILFLPEPKWQNECRSGLKLQLLRQ